VAAIDERAARRRARASRLTGLYAVTPDVADTADLVARVEAAIEGGAAAIQYRNKQADAALRHAQAAALARVARARGALLIVNDDAALALEVGAAGVHLGAEDGDIADARRLLGPARLLGVSCYDQMDLAMQADAAGADYVAFGSFFASPTKPAARRADLPLIRQAKQTLRVPVAVIGGVRADNAAVLVDAGADWLCVISALFDAADANAVRDSARRFAALYA
jgi:thiamine-phosphate pyrophosphorylase